MSWRELGAVLPTALAAARLQAHWGVQLIGAAGDATVEVAADDSHSNAAWDRALGGWRGKGRAGLRLTDLTLVLLDDARAGVADELPLGGRTLADALAWLSERLGAALAVRDYDMPAHPVAQGQPFAIPDAASLAELARWYATADEALATRAGEGSVATWPHHFDHGALLVLDPTVDGGDPPSIWLGMSPGDDYYAQPYYYVNPYHAAEGAALPQLAAGHWQPEGFTGAILTASAIVAAGDRRAIVDEYLTSAIAACRALLGR